ncbi:MAG: DNA recombination protein RmuC [Fibromonadales bacterium]|nr:DNA recombination protein RmuC [Fibromonadales bacterium]
MEDSISVSVAIIDTVHRVITDSVTLEALKNSQEFYSTAFDKIVAIFGVFVMIVLAPGVWNFWMSEKKLTNTKKRILDLENELREKVNKVNEDLEKLKKDIKNMKNELRDVKNTDY